MIRVLVGAAALLAIAYCAPTQSPLIPSNRVGPAGNAPIEQSSSNQTAVESAPLDSPAPLTNQSTEAKSAESVETATSAIDAPEEGQTADSESASETSNSTTTAPTVDVNVPEVAASADATSGATTAAAPEGTTTGALNETASATGDVLPQAIPAVAAAAPLIEANNETAPVDSVEATTEAVSASQAANTTIGTSDSQAQDAESTETAVTGESTTAAQEIPAEDPEVGTNSAPDAPTKTNSSSGPISEDAVTISTQPAIVGSEIGNSPSVDAPASNGNATDDSIVPPSVASTSTSTASFASANETAETDSSIAVPVPVSQEGSSPNEAAPSDSETTTQRSEGETSSTSEGTTTTVEGSTTEEAAPFVTEAASAEETEALQGGVPAGAPILAPVPADPINAAAVPFNRVNVAQAAAAPISPVSDQAGEGAAGTNVEAPQEEAGVTEAPVVDSKIDVDGNGRLSEEETQAAAFAHHGLPTKVVTELFAKADTNGDKELDGTEFALLKPLVIAEAEKSAAQLLPLIDEDRSGSISLLEAQKASFEHHDVGADDVERMFLKTDQNVDGELNAVELSKFRRRLRGTTIRVAQKELQVADTDGSGKLNVSETQAHVFKRDGLGLEAVAKMFPSADNDGDGELDAPEYVSIRRLVRAKNVAKSKAQIATADKDGNGKLNLKEAQDVIFEEYGISGNVIEPFFTDDDVDGDGLLDATEFSSTRTTVRRLAIENAARNLATFDSNGDGQIGQTEALAASMEQYGIDPALSAALFEPVDHDKNSELDATEFAEFLSLARIKSTLLVEERINNVDTNGDGSVSLEEAMKEALNTHKVASDAAEGLFEKVDHDGDKKLTPVELVAFRRQIGKLQSPVELAAETVKADPSAEQAPKVEESEASVVTEATTAAPVGGAIVPVRASAFDAAAPNPAAAAQLDSASESSTSPPVAPPAQSPDLAQAKTDEATAVIDQAEENAEAVAGPPETTATTGATSAAITPAVPAEPEANAAPVPPAEVVAEVDPAATAATSQPEVGSAVPSSQGTVADSAQANAENGTISEPTSVEAGNVSVPVATAEISTEAPVVGEAATSTESVPVAAEQNVTATAGEQGETVAPAESSQQNAQTESTEGPASKSPAEGALPIQPVDVRRADPRPRQPIAGQRSNARNGGFGGGRPEEPLNEAQAATDEEGGPVRDGLSSPDAAKEQPSNAEQIPQESAASKSDAEAP
uniref:EF-hand domain-containing protein n=1 Tax=Plectus sambesii TaxID=2011161 RepID=A0A914XE11_9BILA